MTLRWAGLVTVAISGPADHADRRRPSRSAMGLGPWPSGMRGEDDLAAWAAVLRRRGRWSRGLRLQDIQVASGCSAHLVVIFFSVLQNSTPGRPGDVAVAELRILGAAEGERLARHRDADVDADHAAGRALARLARDGAAGGEDAGGVAVGALRARAPAPRPGCARGRRSAPGRTAPRCAHSMSGRAPIDARSGPSQWPPS